MKKNLLFIILVIVFAIVAAIFLLTKTSGTLSKADSDFAVDDTSTVTKIFMADKNNNNLTLARKDNGKWEVNNQYPGHKLNIEMLLSTLLKLEVKSPVAKAARQNIIKDLATNAVKVEVYQHKYRIDVFNIQLFPTEKLTKVYYVGPATQDNRGTFMIMEKGDQPYIVYMPGLRGFVSSRFTPIEKYWRDFSIFRKSIPEIKSVKMEFPEQPEASFELINNGSRNYTLVSLSDNSILQHFDTLKVMSFLSGFRNINFEALLNDIDQKTKDSILTSRPMCIISLTDTANVTNKVLTFRKTVPAGTKDEMGNILPFDLDRMYALVNNGKDFTLAQYFALGKILRTKSFFISSEPVGPGQLNP